MRLVRWLSVLVLAAFTLGLAGCDQLGMGGKDKTDAKKDKSSDDDDDDDDDDKKKKKKKKGDDDEDEEEEEEASATPSAAPTPPPEPTPTPVAEPQSSGDAKRYPDETAASGTMAIGATVPARKEADNTSETIVVLQPGNQVDRVATFGKFTLVKWPSKSGDKFGWVDTYKAQKQVDWDAGTKNPGLPGEFDKIDSGIKKDAGTTTPPPKKDSGRPIIRPL